MNLRSLRFSQNTNKKLSRILPSLHRAEILTIFCLYFGRNDDFINSLRNFLTFMNRKTCRRMKLWIMLLQISFESKFSIREIALTRPIFIMNSCKLKNDVARIQDNNRFPCSPCDSKFVLKSDLQTLITHLTLEWFLFSLELIQYVSSQYL